MRILRPQPAGLRCRVRLADGRVFTGALPPERHRALQLGLLHADTRELVELTPGTRAPDGTLALDRRRRPEHYLPGGASGSATGCAALLAHAERIVAGAYARAARGRRAARGGVRRRRAAHAARAAASTPSPRRRFLWIDVDRPGELRRAVGAAGRAAVPPADRIRRLGRRARLLEARRAAARDPRRPGDRRGRSSRSSARNLRLIHALGVDADGRPRRRRPACARTRARDAPGRHHQPQDRRSRRASSTPTSRCPPTAIDELVGDLPDPAAARRAEPPRPARGRPHEDPYKRIAPPEYFRRLAGISVPRGGLVSCPAPRHDDRHPSCSVGADADAGLVLPLRRLRRARRDLRPRLGAARRPVGPRAARRRRSSAPARTSRDAFGEVGLSAATASRDRARRARPPSRSTSSASQDDVDARIAGHDGRRLHEPAAAARQALALVALLLGGDPRAGNGDASAGRSRSPAAGARSRSRPRPTHRAERTAPRSCAAGRLLHR